jgi:uracil-DNA glycosylase
MNLQVDAGWQPVVDAWAANAGPLFERLAARRAAGATIYPPDPLRALRLTPLARCRVVILGQDPYHGPGQAEGLAFSVSAGQRTPPSLRNILLEAGLPAGANSLVPWAERGVLLLNSVLTVEDGQPAAHAGWGWEGLTDALIRAASASGEPKAFLLWGAHAQAKRPLIDLARHLVLTANHPSPLSARRPPLPFIGCGHFAQVRAIVAGSLRGGVAEWLKAADCKSAR